VQTVTGRSPYRFLALTACLLAAAAQAAPTTCPAQGTVLQVLGSGGPIADDDRASTAYLVWIDGRSRILVDAGGGAFLRFGEAGARFDELEHIAISHYHTDHVADLVTLFKTGYFSDRRAPLGISGPDGGGPFPGLRAFLESNLGEGGAYAYLGGYLDGSGGLVKLEAVELDASSRAASAVRGAVGDGVEITAMGVPHGIVPTIAYRVRVGDRDIVFAGDQNGNADEFVDFARGADLLVMHLVVPENADRAGRALHAPPSRIGEIAAAAAPQRLVLSHFMARSLRNLDANVDLVKQRFGGEIIIARDLLCIDLG
jgi:ribonuclease BN (tRNA processing enzyme)